MATSPNICVGCGICCDGHLFDHVPLAEGEEGLCADLGLAVEPGESTARFAQPCACFASGSCTVYDRRPTTCRTFRCRLLRNVEKGRVTTQEAQAVIAKVRAFDWFGAIWPQLEPLAPGAVGRVAKRLAAALETITASADPADLRRQHGPALVRAAALDHLLNLHFRPAKPPAGAANPAKEADPNPSSTG